MKSTRILLAVVVGLALGTSAVAQEGHPLKGTWYGDFGMGNDRNDLTVVLDWVDLTITGVVDPGPNAIPMKSVEMEITSGIPAAEGQRSTEGTPPEFRVRFEVDAPNSAGSTDTFVFDGMIFNPVAGNRRIIGTWTCGDTNGNFQIRRL